MMAHDQTADAAGDFLLEAALRPVTSLDATMASPEVAVPFLPAPAVKVNTPDGRSKVSDSHISLAAPVVLPEISRPLSLPATPDTESTGERHDESAVALPVIDVGGLRSGDPTAREQIIRELRTATEEWGFFQVVNHSVTDELQNRMHAQAKQFFNLPLEEKKRGEIVGPNARLFGYKRLLRPGHAGGDADEFILKESLADTRDPSGSVDSLVSKIWAGGNSAFSDTLQEHCLSVEGLAHQLLELLAEGLGVRRDFYSRHFKEERSGTWRLHRFPPNHLPFDVWRTVPHSDPSVLTLLKQDVGGLQVKKPGGSTWIDVMPLPGSFVVNIGDIFEAWSNGIFPSVEHRVALHEEVERYSMVLFLDARPSMLIDAPPEIIDDTHPAQYVPFIASDFRTNFDKIKKGGDITRGKALDFVRRAK